MPLLPPRDILACVCMMGREGTYRDVDPLTSASNGPLLDFPPSRLRHSADNQRQTDDVCSVTTVFYQAAAIARAVEAALPGDMAATDETLEAINKGCAGKARITLWQNQQRQCTSRASPEVLSVISGKSLRRAVHSIA